MQGGEWWKHAMWVLYQLATALHNTLLGHDATARNAVPEADKLWKDNFLFLGMIESSLLKSLGQLGGNFVAVYTISEVCPGRFA